MRCSICTERVKTSNKERRIRLHEELYCRRCRYICEIFSLNGNVLREYWPDE